MQLELLATKDVQFEGRQPTCPPRSGPITRTHRAEARKTLFKKRNLVLRADEKGLDEALQAALLRKTEREHARLLAIIEEKIEIQRKLVALVRTPRCPPRQRC